MHWIPAYAGMTLQKVHVVQLPIGVTIAMMTKIKNDIC
jgi:hypothetical protein